MTRDSVGKVAVQNLVAVFRAVPESDGTYADIARVAKDHDGDVHPHTIAGWVQAGNADIRANKNATAYTRFTKHYQELVKQHCSGNVNRNRELDRALEILERTCECGNEKMLLPDGKLAEQCRECQNKVPKIKQIDFWWYSTFFALRAAIQPS